ncbi:MAG TPA: hypothetical protein VH280_20795 [Verrucomicrobiae bacterium]|jgi:hypothetical protein|nr:hypothetical protein [Verrucomicrobiae bacterium]
METSENQTEKCDFIGKFEGKAVMERNEGSDALERRFGATASSREFGFATEPRA